MVNSPLAEPGWLCRRLFGAGGVETLYLEQAEISPAPHGDFLWREDEPRPGSEATAVGEADLGQRLARGSHMELCRVSIFRFVPVIFGLL